MDQLLSAEGRVKEGESRSGREQRSTCAHPGSWGRTEPVAVEKGPGWSCVLSTVGTS